MRVSIYCELLKYNWHIHWLWPIHDEPFLSMSIRPLKVKKVHGFRNAVHLDGICLLGDWSPTVWLSSSSASLNTGLQSVQLIMLSTLKAVVSSFLVGFWIVFSWFCSFCYCCCCCFSLPIIVRCVISGSITCLTFHDNSHMLSASEDRTICVWECQKWECLKVLKGHR